MVYKTYLNKKKFNIHLLRTVYIYQANKEEKVNALPYLNFIFAQLLWITYFP